MGRFKEKLYAYLEKKHIEKRVDLFRIKLSYEFYNLNDFKTCFRIILVRFKETKDKIEMKILSNEAAVLSNVVYNFFEDEMQKAALYGGYSPSEENYMREESTKLISEINGFVDRSRNYIEAKRQEENT